MAKTGNTGTISFGTSALTGSFTSIGEWKQTCKELETTHLGTTGFKTYIPDDTSEPGEIAFELQYSPTVTLPGTGVVETVTATFPKEVNTNVAAKLVGSGWLKDLGTPELKNGQIMIVKGVFKFNGLTGPAYTKEAPASSSSSA